MAHRVTISIPDDFQPAFARHKDQFNVSEVCTAALRRRVDALESATVFDSLAARLGVRPVVFGWPQLVGGGLPQLDDYTPGLYAVVDHRCLYIGRGDDLMRRVGQLVGAAMGGWGLHSGGWRLYRHLQRGRVDRAALRFAMFPGADVDEEGVLLAEYNPLLNVAGLRDVAREVLFDWSRLAPAFAGESLDPAVLGALLDEVVRSVRRRPTQLADWAEDGWAGAGRALDRRGRHTLYAGVKDGAVGLWAYEGAALWLGRGPVQGERPARSVEALQALVARFVAGWTGSDALAGPEPGE